MVHADPARYADPARKANGIMVGGMLSFSDGYAYPSSPSGRK